MQLIRNKLKMMPNVQEMKKLDWKELDSVKKQTG